MSLKNELYGLMAKEGLEIIEEDKLKEAINKRAEQLQTINK